MTQMVVYDDQKIAVTIPRQTLANAKRAVRAGRARSLSDYISRALEQNILLDDLDSLLDELLQKSGIGHLRGSERRFADSILSGRKQPTPRRRR